MISNKLKKAAVILSGCGRNDGSEITETVSMLICLSQHKIQTDYFSPNKDQLHTIDHQNNCEQESNRNVLIESARITRGNVQALDNLQVHQYDAVFVPGGFGMAKNLSDFAVKGQDFQVDSVFKHKIEEFHKEQKVIGSCCIAPLMIAKCLQNKQSKLKLTLGQQGNENEWPYQGTIGLAEQMGCQMEMVDVEGVVVDHFNRLVTTPAFMYALATPAQIHQAIHNMVNQAVQLANL